MLFQFGLRDLPEEQTLQEYALRFPDLDKEAAVAALALLRTASDLSKVFDSFFASFDISWGRFIILMLLYREYPQSLDFALLSERAEITKATLTGLIDGLDNQGLVERRPHPTDRRKQLLCLTAEGLALLERMLPSHYRTTAYYMSGLNKAELLELTELLNRLHEVLTTIRE
ncbi:MarR-type HTH domain protein [Acididesulfobacillus acetoxydans]|uniref:MarR-type HTH domain protein n=1 Tax=Acididesulfobacillus acetoxydans TaxID=1561005 RepID=A0A8S0VXK0_9FIRM|nr:MarR family transcriptional regulator [Acididesulfobacillus acetoxydans]CAA7601993.1 MarR-type HTH domain protein [Acididesulfobacillus acetoxydans]CEJ08163.1 Transcriptional regulator [Acididesulfobacillus acetoxydans]